MAAAPRTFKLVPSVILAASLVVGRTAGTVRTEATCSSKVKLGT
jgi:hypothetical protein